MYTIRKLDRSVFLRTLLLLSLYTVSCTGLRCYKCGTGYSSAKSNYENAVKLESCEAFEAAGSWSYYAVTCASETVCAKIINLYANQTTTQRGCVLLTTSVGYNHDLRCGPMMPTVKGVHEGILHDGGTSCFCDTDLCNSGTPITLPYLLISTIVVFLTFFSYRY